MNIAVDVERLCRAYEKGYSEMFPRADYQQEIIAARKDQYPAGHVLMIGDAPGDRDAAQANGVLFYPICPDQEAKSWAQFGAVAQAFLSGVYAGAQEAEKIAYFNTLLPETPAWERG